MTGRASGELVPVTVYPQRQLLAAMEARQALADRFGYGAFRPRLLMPGVHGPIGRCSRCAARHKPDVPCASPMGAVRGCWPSAAEVRDFVALEGRVTV